MIDTAIKALLAADGTLTAMIGTFVGQPAIFTQNSVPATFERGSKPYIALRDGEHGPYLDGDRDFFVTPVDILALAKDDGDAASVEAVANRIRDLLDGASLAPSGYTSAGTAIESGPSPDDPDDFTFGRRLRVIVGLIETP
jgi:hypothetical protein